MIKDRLPPLRLTAAIAFLLILDQVTKHLVWSRFALGESIPVIEGFFSLTYVRNIGAAWGIMSGWGWLLISLAVAMLVFVTLCRVRLFGDGRLGDAVFLLLFSGITGNLFDRIRLGYVVDFLDFFHGNWHFPAFNVADICICVSVGLYFIQQYLEGKKESRGAAPVK